LHHEHIFGLDQLLLHAGRGNENVIAMTDGRL
jgi:hypothetical protein